MYCSDITASSWEGVRRGSFLRRVKKSPVLKYGLFYIASAAIFLIFYYVIFFVPGPNAYGEKNYILSCSLVPIYFAL